MVKIQKAREVALTSMKEKAQSLDANATRQPGRRISSRSVQTQMSASSGTSSSERLRATSKRHGEMTSSVTCAPSSRSICGVPSSEPVSNTTTQSASRMDSIQRRTNLASFLQIA